MRSNEHGGRRGSSSYVEVRLGSQFTAGVRALLILYAVTYVAGLIPPLDIWIAQYLMLRPIAAIGGAPYQLLTAPLLMNSLISFLFLGLLLWQIGSAIEERIGTRKFLQWSASTLFVSTLAAALVGRFFPVLGAIPLPIDGHPLFPLLLLAFAHYYGTTQAQMWGMGQPVSGRGLAYFFIGIGLVAGLLSGQWLSLVSQLAALGWSFLLLRRPWAGLQLRKPRKLKVVDGGQPWRAKPDEAKWLN